jgi:hypothetical protein
LPAVTFLLLELSTAFTGCGSFAFRVCAIYTYNSQPFDKKLYTQTTYLLVSEEGEAKQDDLKKRIQVAQPFFLFQIECVCCRVYSVASFVDIVPSAATHFVAF